MIYEVLQQVRNTTSKNEKIAILEKNKDCPALKEYLYQTYSPRINFYMRKIPKVTHVGHAGEEYFAALFPVIANALSERKVTGKLAAESVAHALVALDDKRQQLLSWMILKDVKAGFNVSTINKVWPGLIFEPPYMRCSLESDVNFNKWDWHNTHYVQLKADGMFVNVICLPDSIEFMSRQGSVFPSGVLGRIEDLVKRMHTGMVYTGELTIVEQATGEILPRTTGNGILNSALQGAPVEDSFLVRLDLWDSINHASWVEGEEELGYCERLEDLRYEVGKTSDTLVQVIETREVDSLEDAKDIASEWMELGFEGAVLKNAEMPWKDHTSKLQVKLKKEVCVELRAVSLVAGKATGKNAALFGSIRCESEDGQLVVDIPGFSDELRQKIYDDWATDFEGRVVTVKANDLLLPGKNNEKHSLYLPRFIEWRYDKTVADTVEQIQTQFENAGV